MLKSLKKGDKIHSLKSSHERFKHLDIAQLIDFHLVFDDLILDGFYYDIFEAIEAEILSKTEILNTRFNLENEVKIALCKLARNDRKKFGLNKIFSRQTSMKIYAKALELGILSIEKSLEKPRAKNKNQKSKKRANRYKIQDKLNFTNNFTRFWFYFIQPNLNAIQNGEKDRVLRLIKDEFYGFCGLGFEMLCREFLSQKFQIANITSLWVKDIEIDCFAVKDSKILVAEAKFKEHKVCKNVINLLFKKCLRLGFTPDTVVIFSKSGFSNELMELKSDKILLYGLDDFKEIL